MLVRRQLASSRVGAKAYSGREGLKIEVGLTESFVASPVRDQGLLVGS
jgi:hypothetical protein